MSDVRPQLPQAGPHPHPSPPRGEATPEPNALFVYGTLLFPEVLHALIGRKPESVMASAPGWRAAVLYGRPYPGLVPADGAVTGRLLMGLEPEEWRVLDAFEGEEYEPRRIELADGRPGWVYVWLDPESVATEDWSAEQFAARHLADYVDNCAAWRD
ncbi:gamma-glutamylcyclotransferase family protein [Salinactinospora qingdaonensis]|uniref:Putative gamma-glutamylcyclotransferase n=1 Tax=Salinactinospora qingdaonensis TaxID=702744 RepID=A0ABP7GG82_9ACTN